MKRPLLHYHKISLKQESIPEGCVPLAFLIGGGLPIQTPLDRDPWKKHGTRDRDPPKERTWDQAARQEVTSYREPPVNND